MKEIMTREKNRRIVNKNYRGRGRGFRGRGQGRYEQSDKKQYQCYTCKRYGHFSYECYSKPQSKVAEKINFTIEEELEANSTVLLPYKGEENIKENIWYLDSGASNHMCGIKELFTELNESTQGEVAFW